VAGEEQLADPIQRVGLAAPVMQGLVLHAAADLVDATVPDPHDMERIGDAGGVIEVRGQPGPERLGQVRGHHADPGQPPGIRVGGPSPQVRRLVAFNHVDHDPRLEINQASRVDRRVAPVRPQERGLIDTEMRDRSDPAGVIDQRSAVLDHRVHHWPPAHSELVGDARHGPGVLTDLAARLCARPTGQHDQHGVGHTDQRRERRHHPRQSFWSLLQ